MILPDVNVLVHGHRALDDDQMRVREWLKTEVESRQPFALADIVVAGFLRVITHTKIFDPPSPLDKAVAYVDGLAGRANCLHVSAGPNHWPILRDLLTNADARGNIVPDAHLAAIALEHGATIATRDHGFARFKGLRWLDPMRESKQ